jgi:DNA replication protein DnaC
VCELCGGLGWISWNVPIGDPRFGKLELCPHRQAEKSEAVAQRAMADLGHLSEMTFENFDPEGHGVTEEQRNSLRRAYQWLYESAGEDSDNKPSWVEEPRGWVLLQGSYGCGKTHLAAAIANARLSKNKPVLFVTVPDLLDYLRAAYSPTVEETFEQRFIEVRDAPLLILDDLGAQSATPWAAEKLYQILNARYMSKAPTVITTNLDLEDFEPRIRSRLSDNRLVRKCVITAPDYRQSGIKHGQSSVSTHTLYEDKTFESYDLRFNLPREQHSDLEEAVQTARDFAANPENWLMFTGKYGVGKTHLAAAIANYRIENGYPAMFVVVPDLLDHLRATFSPDSRMSFDQRFEEVRSTRLLILDDLGTESATPWAREKLFQILNHRYAARLPTVITTSVAADDLDARIRTRVLDQTLCEIVHMNVPPYRSEAKSNSPKQERPRKKTK